MNIEIGYVCSNRKQVCRKCGKDIQAGTESVKYVKKLRGRVSLAETWHTCMECEKEENHDGN